ncbi:MAG: gliding motility lipoprotein GldH [Petrimonas sp.]|uniref:gliding motility lipoprotein GldH n=1 Tax=Petrimonas sp. TaxID=2023866 RepID=UPI002B3B4CEB|nr:gliding motility lipoprotein GldH [Petrimonas sp.]MEA4979365.1 gliding motility lipoprotein GldH [Petrimonas sp.]MEA5045456.1 gliding motility lipoprotein GldH [Petrimonas sp.]
MSNRRFIVFFVVIAFLSSCDEEAIYYRFHPIKNNDWSRRAAVDFLLDSLSVDPDKRYDIMLDIVSSNQYPYQNIWLSVQQNVTDTAFVSDTIEIKLADSHGKWLGKGSAGLYQLSVPYKTSIALDPTRAYLIRIRQAMKDNSIKGIEKVGVLVK